jgi:hypothetical protein
VFSTGLRQAGKHCDYLIPPAGKSGDKESGDAVVGDLRQLSRNMLDIADAMWRLGAGAEVDAHAKELTGAARIAQDWADGIERESGDAAK